MPRDLPLGNGQLLVNFDSRYNLRDIFFPHAGQANHAYGCTSRLGVRVGGKFSWVGDDDAGWELELRYARNTLVTDVKAVNADLGVSLRIQDAVDFHRNLLVRSIDVTNEGAGGGGRDVRVFQHLDFSFWGTTVGDSAFWLPERRAIVGYQNGCYMLLGGAVDGRIGFDSWSMDHKDPEGGSGSWRDAEDGDLAQRTLAFGSVDCVAAVDLGAITAGDSARAEFWLGVGSTLEEVQELDELVRARGSESFRRRTNDYWRAWSEVEGSGDVAGGEMASDPMMTDALRRSLLVVRTHIDHEGGIIAAGDSEISAPHIGDGSAGNPTGADPLEHEHYSYVWPRDAAMIGLALGRAAYAGLSRKLIGFCDRVLSYDAGRDWGYMLQKYYPSGTVASSWIPWVDEFGKWKDADGNPRLPIQEDETALVMVLLWDHFERYRDWELITPLYRRFIKPIGNLLRDYRDRNTGLPLPSTDLWEERDGVHAYTAATVWAGLQAVERFVRLFGEEELASEYGAAADEVKAATEAHLYDEAEGRFARSLIRGEGGGLERDGVVDASVYALFYFGMFDADDPRIERTMDAVIERLTVRTMSGGVARYEGDVYQRVEVGPPDASSDNGPPGNPWFICSLWVAEYHIRRARSLEDLEPARAVIEWARGMALPSGVMGEQLDPYTGGPVSATPLAWSHATLVSTILEYFERRRLLAGGAVGGMR